MKSSATKVDIAASARNSRKSRSPPESIPGIPGGIAKTLGKVFAGSLTVSIVLGFAHFQYHVDDLAPPRKIEKAFYADIYAPPAVAKGVKISASPEWPRPRAIQPRDPD